MAEESGEGRVRAALRNAVGGAVDATVGRAGHAAREFGAATVRDYVDELEPYLIEETVPKVVEGVTPLLIDSIVPEVIDGVTQHLIDVTVPNVLAGVTPVLVESTVPQILAGLQPYLQQQLVPQIVDALMPKIEQEIAPQLVDALMPKIEREVAPQVVASLMPALREEIAPELIDALMPKIEEQIAPQLVDALMPKIEEQVAPQLVDALMPKIEREVAPQVVASLMPALREEIAPELIDALMPKIEQEIAPQLVDALMPKIEEQVAPQLVDALMPKIQREVVPAILDEIVDDPRVRTLIREQSQGLMIDALERIRIVAANVDDRSENLGRRMFGRKPRPTPDPETQVTLPGRRQVFAGAVSRGLAFLLDITLVSFAIGLGLNLLLGLKQGFFENSPYSLDWLASIIVFLGTPAYFATMWWLGGSTVGDIVMGVRICRRDDRPMRFVGSWVRAWLLLYLVPVWIVGMIPTAYTRHRRSWLDKVTGTEARYMAGALWTLPGAAKEVR